MGAKKLEEQDFSKRAWITLNECYAYCGISGETVRKWTRRTIEKDKKPPLKAMQPGKDILVKKKDLDLYIEQFPVTE
jgi:hypothetical protein